MGIEKTSFIHFNDVYNVEKSPPFVTSVKSSRKKLQESKDGRHVITIFSGDAFSPSIMSTILRGEQMVPALNAIGIDAACLGNHDLDFGSQEFRELKDQCNFPWLCSNAWDSRLDEPLGGCKEFEIIDKSSEGGPKLLVIGLIEQGWLETLSSVDPAEVIFEDPADFVKRRVPELEKEFGPFDAVVAASHMRMPNDIALAESGGIDIILGGHDHHYEDTVVNGIRVLNSGADFKSYTIIGVAGRNSSGKLDTNSRCVKISADDESDKGVAESIKEFQDLVNESMGKVVGRTKVPLDARFSEVRTKETNIGNFLAELMTRATGADVAILNSGSIRADRVIDKGELTLRDLCDILPMQDEKMVVSLTGDKLLLVLENAISRYPAMEGRFPCVDGVRFSFDPKKPPGSRIDPDSVTVRSDPIVKRRRTTIRGSSVAGDMSSKENGSSQNGESKNFIPLDLSRSYSVVSTAYLVSGKEGFDAFIGAPVLRQTEECPLLPTMLRNVFTELRALRFWSDLTVQGTVIKAATKFKRFARRSVADPHSISPCVDGRITILDGDEGQS